MQAAGGKALDAEHFHLAQGDIMVIPENNTNTFPVSDNAFSLRDVIEAPTCSFLAVVNQSVGAGFYADLWGPLPFAFGSVPSDRYEVFSAEYVIESRNK